MTFADHRVTLTVITAARGIDVDWALIDRGLSENDTAPVIGCKSSKDMEQSDLPIKRDI